MTCRPTEPVFSSNTTFPSCCSYVDVAETSPEAAQANIDRCQPSTTCVPVPLFVVCRFTYQKLPVLTSILLHQAITAATAAGLWCLSWGELPIYVSIDIPEAYTTEHPRAVSCCKYCVPQCHRIQRIILQRMHRPGMHPPPPQPSASPLSSGKSHPPRQQQTIREHQEAQVPLNLK